MNTTTNTAHPSGSPARRTRSKIAVWLASEDGDLGMLTVAHEPGAAEWVVGELRRLASSYRVTMRALLAGTAILSVTAAGEVRALAGLPPLLVGAPNVPNTAPARAAHERARLLAREPSRGRSYRAT